MAKTLRQMTGELRMYVPDAPVLLCQKHINEAYLRALDMGDWSGLRAQAQFLIANPYTAGTIAATRGSNTFTGTGTAWTSSMVGWQLKVNNQSPVLTVTAVNTLAQTLTTDEVWGLQDYPTAPYTLVQLYVTVPSDFGRFVAVTDPLRQWRLWWWFSQNEINALDPARTATGDPWILADQVPDAAGIPRYELWPAPTVGRTYPYYYYRKGVELTQPDDEPVRPFTGTEIVNLALADLCAWPGTPNMPNPLFGNTSAQQSFLARAQRQINDLERKDQDLYLTWFQGALGNIPYAPLMDSWTQSHAMYQY